MAEPLKFPGAGRFLAPALILLLGLGGGAGVRHWLGVRVHPGKAARGGVFAGAALSADASAMWARIVDALGGQGGRRLTFAKLLELLCGHKKDAAAQAFAADFQKDPQLMSIWDQYAHSNEALDAAWLAEKLSESRAFAELMSKHAGSPAFRAAGHALAGDVKGAVERTGLLTDAKAGLRRGSLAADLGAAGAPAAAKTDPILAYAGPGAGRAAFAAMARRYAAAGGETTSESRGGAIATRDAGSSGEIKTTALARLAGAGNSATLEALDSLFTKMDKDARDKILNNLDDQGDMWGACTRAGLKHTACEKAVTDCRTDPACRTYLALVPAEPPDPPPSNGESGGGGGGPRCPGPNCDQCGSNPGMAGCGDWASQHPADAAKAGYIPPP